MAGERTRDLHNAVILPRTPSAWTRPRTPSPASTATRPNTPGALLEPSPLASACTCAPGRSCTCSVQPRSRATSHTLSAHSKHSEQTHDHECAFSFTTASTTTLGRPAVATLQTPSNSRARAHGSRTRPPGSTAHRSVTHSVVFFLLCVFLL